MSSLSPPLSSFGFGFGCGLIVSCLRFHLFLSPDLWGQKPLCVVWKSCHGVVERHSSREKDSAASSGYVNTDVRSSISNSDSGECIIYLISLFPSSFHHRLHRQRQLFLRFVSFFVYLLLLAEISPSSVVDPVCPSDRSKTHDVDCSISGNFDNTSLLKH